MMPGMGRGVNPRQMKQAMKRMGISQEEMQGVEEVVIRTADKEYVIKGVFHHEPRFVKVAVDMLSTGIVNGQDPPAEVADGIALVQVMLSMTDSWRDAPLTDGAPPPPRPKGWNPLAPVTRPATAALKMTQKTVGAATRTSLRRRRRNPPRTTGCA